jgi:hypothetical protein
MLDFLDAGSGSTPGVHPYDRYHDRRRIKGPEVYRNALRAIREAAGKDTYLLSSTGPTFQNIGMVHAVRTGNDFGEGRAVRKGTWFYPGTIALGAGEHLDWSSALRNMAANYFVHGRWYDNDAGNVLAVDKPLPLNQARVHATFFGIGGGPMMLGDDIDRIDEERLALIKKCLPRTAEVAVPLDLFTSCGPDDRPMVFRLDIRRPWGAYTILAVFNDRPGERARTLSVRQLGLAPSAIHQIYDFWNDSAWSFSGETLALAVAGNSVGLYRIQRRRSHPWLLSSDMHVLQGAVEVAELTWDARTKTLAGWVSRPRGEQGNLFFTAPEGWKPVDYEGLWVAKQAADRSILVKKHLVFRRERLRWSVRFERYT